MKEYIIEEKVQFSKINAGTWIDRIVAKSQEKKTIWPEEQKIKK